MSKYRPLDSKLYALSHVDQKLTRMDFSPLGLHYADLIFHFPNRYFLCGSFSPGFADKDHVAFESFFKSNHVFFMCNKHYDRCVVAVKDPNYLNEYYYVHECLSSPADIKKFSEHLSEDRGLTPIQTMVNGTTTTLETFRRCDGSFGTLTIKTLPNHEHSVLLERVKSYKSRTPNEYLY